MAEVIIRDLDAELVALLEKQATERGRSLEAHVRDVLRLALNEKAPGSFRELAARSRAATAGRRHTPSQVLLREGRDER